MNLRDAIAFHCSADFMGPGVIHVPKYQHTMQAVVRKQGGKWCVFSESTNRNFGCYGSREEAAARLAQMEKFKHMKADASPSDLAHHHLWQDPSPTDTEQLRWIAEGRGRRPLFKGSRPGCSTGGLYGRSPGGIGAK